MDDVMKLVLFLSKWVWEEEEKSISGLVGLAFGLINILERKHIEDVKDDFCQIDLGDDFIFKQNIPGSCKGCLYTIP